MSWPSPSFQGRAENVTIHKRSILMSCLCECNSSIEDFKKNKLFGQHVQNASGKHKFSAAAKVMATHTHTLARARAHPPTYCMYVHTVHIVRMYVRTHTHTHRNRPHMKPVAYSNHAHTHMRMYIHTCSYTSYT